MRGKEQFSADLSPNNFQKFIKKQEPEKLSEIAEEMGRKRKRSGAEAVGGAALFVATAIASRYIPLGIEILAAGAGAFTAIEGIGSTFKYNGKRSEIFTEMKSRIPKKQDGQEITNTASPIVKA